MPHVHQTDHERSPTVPNASERATERPPRLLQIVAALFFVLYALATILQGPLLGARIRPTLLGLPLAYAWVAGWVAGAAFVLLTLEWYRRE